MKHLKLYEDWFDELSDHPANIIIPEPNEQTKNEPFKYIFDNEYIIIVEMDGDKYVIDLLNLDKQNPDLYKQLAEDYIGVEQIPGGMGKGHEMESDFEASNIHNLNNIEAEYVVAWLNDEYKDIKIGESVDDFENVDNIITKINNEIKNILKNEFTELKYILR